MQTSWAKVEEIMAKAKAKAEKAKEMAEAVGEQAAQAAMQVVNTVEVGAVAFGFGYLRGRYGDVRLLGIPVDVGTGSLLTLMGLGLLLSGNRTAMQASSHVTSLGAGALACGSAAFGAAIGAEHAAKKKSGQPSVQGAGGYNVVAGGPPAPIVDVRFLQPAPVAPRPLTQDEIAAAAQYRAAA